MSDKFEQIKSKYIATFAQKQSDINAAWDNKDVTQLHKLLHKLAGSSGSYGFSDISQLCHHSIKLIESEEIRDEQLLEKNINNLLILLQTPN